MPIKELAQCSFQRCYLITRVVIEANIETIPYRCFADCNNMIYIEIPSSVHTLGRVAISFYNNINLTNSVSQNTHVVIFKKNSRLKTVGSNAFEYAKQVSLIFESKVNANVDVLLFNHVEKANIYCRKFMRFGNYTSVDACTLPSSNCFLSPYSLFFSILVMISESEK